MLTCPHCNKTLLVFLDIAGELSPKDDQPDQGEGKNRRFQTCATCRTHTPQIKEPFGQGAFKWKCTVCGKCALKVHRDA